MVGGFAHLPNRRNDYEGVIFTESPLLGALLFDNITSDARDHCANERTFLSWLRLSTYMAIVSVAIVISFHLKNQPTKLELRLALPFGIIFWVLSLACLAAGFANYIKTVMRYSKRSALVQSGWKTEVVRHFLITTTTCKLPRYTDRLADIYHCSRCHCGRMHFVPVH